MRADDHRDQATDDLERMQRELTASQDLPAPGSQVRAVIASNLGAVTAELNRRTASERDRRMDAEMRFRWLS